MRREPSSARHRRRKEHRMPDLETPIDRDIEPDTAIPEPDEEMDLEVSEADAVEQLTPATATIDGERAVTQRGLPAEADEADVAEQQSTIEYDEDDYR
jgi:hypothetical protein